MNVPGYSVSVIKRNDFNSATGCYSYVLSIPDGTAVFGVVTQKIVVRRDLAQRLNYRYIQNTKQHDRDICSEKILSLNHTLRHNTKGKHNCLIG